jgi:hypothetical protein
MASDWRQETGFSGMTDHPAGAVLLYATALLTQFEKYPLLHPTQAGLEGARDKEHLGCFLLIAKSQPFGIRIGSNVPGFRLDGH